MASHPRSACGPRRGARSRARVRPSSATSSSNSIRASAGTTANFLRYVDAGHYDGGTFHRTVKMDNQPESPVKIEVIQAGVNEERAKDGFPPIPLERTTVTGHSHKDGTVSMARGAPDSATSGWFICINDQPSLDFGGSAIPTVRASRRSAASSPAWTSCGRSAGAVLGEPDHEHGGAAADAADQDSEGRPRALDRGLALMRSEWCQFISNDLVGTCLLPAVIVSVGRTHC